MDKHRLFPNLANLENQKIHTSKLATRDTETEPTPFDTLLSKSLPATSTLSVIKNILISCNNIKKPPFEERILDNILLRNNHNQIMENTVQLYEQLLQATELDPAELLNSLDLLIVRAIKLGEDIGAYNERIDALQPMRNDHNTKSGRSSGGTSRDDTYNAPVRNLVEDIVNAVEKEARLSNIPNNRLAKAIINLVKSKRQKCHSLNTIKEYIKEARTLPKKSGRPPKDTMSTTALTDWLFTQFSDKVNSYFIK